MCVVQTCDLSRDTADISPPHRSLKTKKYVVGDVDDTPFTRCELQTLGVVHSPVFQSHRTAYGMSSGESDH